MPKLHGSALAFQVIGSIAGLVTFQRPNGQQIAKAKSSPSQPNTASQVAQRALLTTLSGTWLRSSNGFRDQFVLPIGIADYKQDRAAFLGANLRALSGKSDLESFVFSVPRRVNLPALSLDVAPWPDGLVLTGNSQPLPPGFSFQIASFVVARDQDPRSGEPIFIKQQYGAGTPPLSVFTGLGSGITYRCGFCWYAEHPDGAWGFGTSATAWGVTP